MKKSRKSSDKTETDLAGLVRRKSLGEAVEFIEQAEKLIRSRRGPKALPLLDSARKLIGGCVSHVDRLPGKGDVLHITFREGSRSPIKGIVTARQTGVSDKFFFTIASRDHKHPVEGLSLQKGIWRIGGAEVDVVFEYTRE